jgi:hypothetical protein
MGLLIPEAQPSMSSVLDASLYFNGRKRLRGPVASDDRWLPRKLEAQLGAGMDYAVLPYLNNVRDSWDTFKAIAMERRLFSLRYKNLRSQKRSISMSEQYVFGLAGEGASVCS